MKRLTAARRGRLTAAMVTALRLATMGQCGAAGSTSPADRTPQPAARKQALVPQPHTHAKTVVVANELMAIGCGTYGHWGLMTLAGDPDNPNDDNRNLIGSPADGWSNGLAVKIDGAVYTLADDASYISSPLTLGEDGTYATLSWTVAGVLLTARYELAAGTSGRNDTGRFTYTFTNPLGSPARTVTLKIGLDTMIGGNDAARLATASGITHTETGFGLTGGGGSYPAPVPDYWQAYEVDRLDSPAWPGTVGQGTFVGSGATKPDTFIIGQWPTVAYHDYAGHGFEYTPTGSNYTDSAVGLWWRDRSLAPGSSLSFVVLYGLGHATRGGSDLRLTLSAPEVLGVANNQIDPNPFTALVQLQNQTGQTLTQLPVTIDLPPGLSVASSTPTTQYVDVLAQGASTLVAFSVAANPLYGGQTLTYRVRAGAGHAYAVSLEGSTALPQVGVDCDAMAPDLVSVLSLGHGSDSRFPQIIASVRVDSEAAQAADLGAAHFAVREDGVLQTVTSVSCNGVEGTAYGFSALYTVTYTTSAAALDGRWRAVTVSVADPLLGVGCDQTTYQAPLACQDLTVERHLPPDCRRPGELIEVSLSINGTGSCALSSLTLLETLPAGWVCAGLVNGASDPVLHVPLNPADPLEFEWAESPALPYLLEYLVWAPAAAGEPVDGSYGWYPFVGTAEYPTGAGPRLTPILGESGIELRDCPTVNGDPHQTDQNGDWIIQLSPDLTRMIQFHNRRGYHCQNGTEDGYATGEGATSCSAHQADQDGDWVIQLSPDLTRMIQFHNSGGYHCRAGTEDGYAAGLLPHKIGGAKGTLTAVRTFGAAGYVPGGTLDVSVTLTPSNPAGLASLAFQETLPPGWSFNGIVAGPVPPIAPTLPGATGTLGFAWVALPAEWPLTLTYRVNVPSDALGSQVFTGTACFREEGDENTVAIPPTRVASGAVTLIFGAGAGGSIDMGSAVQTLFIGQDAAPVTAVADPGFVFTHWARVGDEQTTTGNPLTLTEVTDSAAWMAFFREADAAVHEGCFLAVVDVADAMAGRALWDLTGAYATTVQGTPLALAVAADSRGRLTGQAALQVATPTAVIPVALPVKGSVRGANGALRVAMAMHGKHATSGVKVTLALDLALDVAARQLRGRATGSIRTGAATTHIDDSVALDLPADMDGTWTLLLQIGPDDRTVTGTATLTLSNDSVYRFALRGRTVGPTVVMSLSGYPGDLPAQALRATVAFTPLEGGWARLHAVSLVGLGQALR